MPSNQPIQIPQSEEGILLIGGRDPDSFADTTKCEIFEVDGRRQKKHFVPDLPKRAQYAAITSDEEAVYVMCAEKDVYKLTSHTMRWSKCRSMLNAYYFHTAAMKDHYVVVMGSNSNKVHVQIYDTKRDAWYRGPTLSGTAGERKAASVNYNGDIIYSGGLLKVKPIGETSSNAVWKLILHPGAGIWVKMPSMRQPRHSHTMAVVGGNLYVIGGNESPCDIEMLTPDGSCFVTTSMRIPVCKCQTNAIVHDKRILLLPGLSTSKVSDANLQPPGKWSDDSMVTILPNSSDPTSGTVDMTTLTMNKVYSTGSHATLIKIPSNRPETLHSLLASLEYLPPIVGKNEKNTILEQLNDLLTQPLEVVPMQHKGLGLVRAHFQQILWVVFKALLKGVDFDLMTKMIDDLVSHFRGVNYNLSYSLVADAFINFSITVSHYIPPDQQIPLLEYLLQKEAGLKPKSIWNLIKSKKASLMPQIYTLTVTTRPYLKLLQLCHKLFHGHQTCRAFDVTHCRRCRNLRKILYNIAELDMNCSQLKLIERVLKDPTLKELCTNMGTDPRALDTCNHIGMLLDRVCPIIWDGGELRCLKGHRDNGIICCADMEYVKTLKYIEEFKNNGHLPGDLTLMAPVTRKKITAGVVKVFESISKQMSNHYGEQLEFDVRIIGSVAEGTKVGRYDEFDVELNFRNLAEVIKGAQIGCHGSTTVSIKEQKLANVSKVARAVLQRCMENNKLEPHCFGQRLDKMLRDGLRQGNFNWDSVPFCIVGTSHPWQLLCTDSDHFGMSIFIDIVPVINLPDTIFENIKFDNAEQNNFHPSKVKVRVSELIDNPTSYDVRLWLKWPKPGEQHRWCCTVSQHEREIMLNLPSVVREGFRLTKFLLEIDHWKQGGHYSGSQKLVTSYMVKNALFWLLKSDIEKGGMMKLQPTSDGEVPQQLSPNAPNVTEFALRLLQHLKHECQTNMDPRSFTIPDFFLYQKAYLPGIVATCDKLLDIISPDRYITTAF